MGGQDKLRRHGELGRGELEAQRVNGVNGGVNRYPNNSKDLSSIHPIHPSMLASL